MSTCMQIKAMQSGHTRSCQQSACVLCTFRQASSARAAASSCAILAAASFSAAISCAILAAASFAAASSDASLEVASLAAATYTSSKNCHQMQLFTQFKPLFVDCCRRHPVGLYKL
jgi:hypothetical protein